MAEVATVCPGCGTTMRTEYRRLGAACRCPACARDVVPRVPTGTRLPVHASELTYHDFRQLIENPAYRREIAALLARWFACTLRGEHRETLVVDGRGEALDPLELHLRIQDTPAQQAALYQQAMSLWR